MQSFEKLGVFYLGRRFEPGKQIDPPEAILYDSCDLVTHALCVGMTGSGKTGLGLALIEEAAIDGVSVIAIDPKGDLTNLLLTFPELRPADFEPWVNPGDAARAGLSVPEFAAQQAERWSKGLADWDQHGERIARLKQAAEYTVYTPGSTAGVPVSVLGSFAPPLESEPELRSERAQITVSSLLTLAGINADASTNPAHILLSLILLAAWEAGESPDLAVLIQRVQTPPIQTVGVMAVDAFMPQKDRFALAMALNALIAAPGFKVWTEGDPLDVGAFLRTSDGRPRVSIFSIAHLDDRQRMFFVAQLLNAVLGWMRSQTGTSSLRALVYMDEIFGYFPPVANPPSKLPLISLLKQGRAFGLGVVLATQNPVDLDYKGLGNIGTWWLGRLQTERDKQRLLDGLEGAHVEGGMSRAQLDSLISSLEARTFLMRNIHDEGLTLFQTRWVMSYMRGPLSREEIRRLMEEHRPAEPSPAAASAPVVSASADSAPALPPGVAQYYAPAAPNSTLQPMLYASLDVHYVSVRLKVDETRRMHVFTPIVDAAIPVHWEAAEGSELTPGELLSSAPQGAAYLPLPADAGKASSYTKWNRQLKTWVRKTHALALYKCRRTGEVSAPGETQREFQARIHTPLREQRDEALQALRAKYASRRATQEERVRRARQAIERESQQAASQRLDTAMSVGATLAGALLGGRSRRRIGTTVRIAGRAVKQGQDVARARETHAAAQQTLYELDARFEAEALKLQAKYDVGLEALETVTVSPRSQDIEVRLLALVWMPVPPEAG